MTSSSTATPSAAQTAVTVLEDGFALFKQSAVECLPLSVLAVAVGQWPQLTGLSHSSRPGAFLLTCIAAALGCWLLTLIVLRQAAMQSATPTPWRVSLRLATRRLPSLLLLVIAMLLIVVVGLAVLIVPGVYLAVAALPAFYLLIIEGLSVRAALDGALQLVRKRWWQSAYVLLLVGIGVLVLFTIDIALNLVVTQLTGRLPSAGVSGVIGLLVSAVFQPFCIAVGLMQYRFLRQAAPPDVPVAEAG